MRKHVPPDHDPTAVLDDRYDWCAARADSARAIGTARSASTVRRRLGAAGRWRMQFKRVIALHHAGDLWVCRCAAALGLLLLAALYGNAPWSVQTPAVATGPRLHQAPSIPLISTSTPALGTLARATPQDTTPLTLTATTTPTTPATMTATLNGADRFLTTVDYDAQRVGTAIFDLLKAGALILIAATIWRLLRVLFQNRPQLVVDTIANASGNGELDKVMSGVSELLREQLVPAMQAVYDQVKESTLKPQGVKLDKTPLPRATPDGRLSSLVDSLKQSLPADAQPAVPLIRVVFPPHGRRIASTLQCTGSASGTLGITFDIAALGGEDVPEPHTIWEPDGQPSPMPDKRRSVIALATRGIETWIAGNRSEGIWSGSCREP